MDARIQQITLVVKSKADALEFYTEKVGFEKKTDVTDHGYRYVTVGPKGQDVELSLWEIGSPDAIGWSKDWKPRSAPPIFLVVDDCRKAFAELKAKGVHFREEPKEYPWGVWAIFSDPDGNLFQINQFSRRSP